MRSSLALILALGFVLVPACGDPKDEGDTSTDTGDGDGDGDGDGELTCEDEWVDKDPDSGVESIQQTWGAACTTDQECKDLIGIDDAVCITNILDIYTPPGGYCTRYCNLPDASTLYIPDDPNCDPGGGVTCLGAMGIFEVCAKPCTDDNQCGREGYACILMPQLGNEEKGHPKFCLMNPDACCMVDECP